MRSEWIRTGVIVGLLSSAFLFSACSTTPSSQVNDASDSGFTSLWNAYGDCKSTSDLAKATTSLDQLRSAGRLGQGKDEFILPLPNKLAHLVSTPTSRVAVDIEAMTSACALHTGELAFTQGYLDVARELFVSIIRLHEGQNSYYAVRAKTLLAKLEQGLTVSFNAR
ncbi:MAG: hypothetical protein OEV01_00925 [Nitrospira sp.]|nr:hypothetical protein [Nitrospira sp.]